MANFTNPIKEAFGRYLQRFHAMLLADTPAMAEYAARPFSKAAVWAPERMVDQVEEMLAAWRKNDTSRAARATPFLPIMIAAMSKDYMPAQPDFTRQMADPVDVMIPGDVKQRVFKMRAASCEVRAQVVIAAAEAPTAKSIAMQLQLFSSAIENRRLYATYRLAGCDEKWPAVQEQPEILLSNVPTDQKNITLLMGDFTWRATVPMLMFPKPGAFDADGQGVPGSGGPDASNYEDPDGYLVVQQADFASWPDVNPDPDNIPPGVEPETFSVGEF